jgi:uncharacterized membrane protein
MGYILAILGDTQESPKIFLWLESRCGAIACIVITVHFLIFAGLIILRHHQFGGILGEDTGYYNQIFWSTLHGDFFKGSLTQQRYVDPPVSTEFALHNSPILLLLLPIYWIYPSFYTLLVLKSAALSLSGAPLYLLAKERIGGVAAVVVLIVYLFSKNIVSQAINGFHSIEFIGVFLLFAFYFFWQRRLVLFLVCLLLALSVREEAALTTVVFGIYALWLKRTWKWVVIPMLVSVAWWYCSTELVLVRSQISMEGLDKFFLIFGSSRNDIIANVLRSPGQLIAVIATKATVEYVWEIVRPTGLIAIGSIVSVFAFPTMSMNILIGAFWPTMLSVTQHYSLIATVCVFPALVEAVERIGWKQNLFNLRRSIVCAGITSALVLPAAMGLKDIVQFGGGNGESIGQDFRPKPYVNTLRSIVKQVEPDAAVAAPGILLPHMSYRSELYHSLALWRYYDPELDYIILISDPKLVGLRGEDRERYFSMVRAVERNSKYQLTYSRDGFEVYRSSNR